MIKLYQKKKKNFIKKKNLHDYEVRCLQRIERDKSELKDTQEIV